MTTGELPGTCAAWPSSFDEPCESLSAVKFLEEETW